MREGRSPHQIGRKGLSNHRWMVGGKLCLLLKQWGFIVAWDCATANVPENTFQWLIRQFEEQMIVLSDTAFHAAAGDPANLKLCRRGEWEERIKPRHDLLYASASFPRLDFSQSKLPLLRGHQWLTMLPYTTACSVLDAR